MEELGFESRESHCSAHILTHEGVRDAQERKSGGLSDDRVGLERDVWRKLPRSLARAASSWCRHSLQKQRRKEEQVWEKVIWSSLSEVRQMEMSGK